MKTRLFAIGTLLALPLFLSAAVAQSALAQQDTTQAGMRRMHRGMRMHADSAMRGMGMRSMRSMRGMQRMGGMRAMRGANHIGPHMLIGLKSELELTDDQVARLEKIGEDHRALMQAQMQNMQNLRESMLKARAENDFAALEKGIDEGAKLRSGMAKGMLNVEKQTLEVLSDAQQTKYETWQEGARLFRRQGRQMREHMRGMGRGMQMRLHRAPADTTKSQ
jgi:hypothetical protein